VLGEKKPQGRRRREKDEGQKVDLGFSGPLSWGKHKRLHRIGNAFNRETDAEKGKKKNKEEILDFKLEIVPKTDQIPIVKRDSASLQVMVLEQCFARREGGLGRKILGKKKEEKAGRDVAS